MTPPTSTTTATTRFRCGCGRSVVAPVGSDAAEAEACSRCRRRQRPDDATLRRTDRD